MAAGMLMINVEDRTVWKDLVGNKCHLRSLEVWNVIRHHETPVSWVNGVWFSQCIPRHSFHLWYNRDSRDHLFFQCPFASNVWKEIKLMGSLDNVDDSWQSIMEWMAQNATSKKTEHIVCKLLIAAAAYFIWQERNNCLFSNANANVTSVVGRIKHTVRLRLMGFEFRGSFKVHELLEKWKIARSENEDDPG
ncbi:uncharacterized protein LOC110919416 [Helianthus annuus]|uniref:uncharacterized protein LOC110919416 n=1 Tax=Helianthus annuus TaxID=4232 RepID=UPI000B8FB8CB|nr:uncharacterized protein LOC110919416 [Helianthus annuus]